jgi:hypothetical protein
LDYQIFSQIESNITQKISLKKFSDLVLPLVDQAKVLVVSPDEKPTYDRRLRLIEDQIVRFLINYSDTLINQHLTSTENDFRDELRLWEIIASEFLDEEFVRSKRHRFDQVDNLILLRSKIYELTQNIDEANAEIEKRQLGADKSSYAKIVLDESEKKFVQIQSIEANLINEYRDEVNDEFSGLTRKFENFSDKVNDLKKRHEDYNTIIADGEFQELIDQIHNHKEGTFTLKGREFNTKEEALEYVSKEYRQFSIDKYLEYVGKLENGIPNDLEKGTISQDPRVLNRQWEKNLRKVMPLRELQDSQTVTRVQNAQKRLSDVITHFSMLEQRLRDIEFDSDIISRYNRMRDFPISQVPVLKDEWKRKGEEARKDVNVFLQEKIEYFKRQFVTTPHEIHFEIEAILAKLEKTTFQDTQSLLGEIKVHSRQYQENADGIKRLDDLDQIITSIDKLGEGYAGVGLELPKELRELRASSQLFKAPLENLNVLLENARVFTNNLENATEFDLREVVAIEEEIRLFLSKDNEYQNATEIELASERFQELAETFRLIQDIHAFLDVKQMIQQPFDDLKIIVDRLNFIQNAELLDLLSDEKQKVAQWEGADRKVDQNIQRLSSAIEGSELHKLLDAYFEVIALSKLSTTRKTQIHDLREKIVQLIEISQNMYFRDSRTEDLDFNIFDQLLDFYRLEKEGTNEFIEHQQSLLRFKAEFAEKQKAWLKAYISWSQLADRLSSHSIDLKLRSQACLKMHIIQQALNNDFADFDRFYCRDYIDMDFGYFLIDIHLRLQRVRQQLGDIGNISDSLAAKLKAIKNDTLNRNELFSSSAENLSTNRGQNNSQYVMILSEYEAISQNEELVDQFHKKFNTEDLMQLHHELDEVMNKITHVMDKMKISGSLSTFIGGRLLVDEFKQNGYLSEQAKLNFNRLWDQYRHNLLIKINEGGSQ